MNKQLQQEVQEIAKAILRKGDTMNVASMKEAVAMLYEKLSVLVFLEGEHTVKEGVSLEEAIDSKSYREQHWFTEPEPIPQPNHKEDIVEPLMEKIKDLVAQMPPETQEVDKILEEVLPQKKYIKNDLEEFASNYQQTPTFERKVIVENPPAESVVEDHETSIETDLPEPAQRLVDDLEASDKPKSINDSVGAGMRIDLNDRLAYIKHLFGDSADDYTRVVSQINTMRSFAEAETFIKTKVKPEYNFWLQKDMFAERFMAAVERKFN